MVFQVNKSSSDFYNNLKLTWRQCSKLPCKCLASSVARLDEKVYAAMVHSTGAYYDTFMYDSNKDQWSMLPALPCARFSLVTLPDRKQLLAIGGMVDNNGVIEVSNKVFLWHEKKRKWTTPYPNMPTARCYCSSISHGSTVIVAGGVTSWDPWTMTRAVEVLHIKDHTWLTKSYWSVVEQLPLVVREAIPLIINDKLYIAQGFDTEVSSTCNIVTASLPELLKCCNKKTQVWKKLPDMPYSSDSINHYQGRLITFTGDHKVELLNEDKPIYEIVPLIHVYNPDTLSWDCVGDIPYRYLLGRSVHIRGNKILFIGGLTGTTLSLNKDDDMVTTCLILTISPQ